MYIIHKISRIIFLYKYSSELLFESNYLLPRQAVTLLLVAVGPSRRSGGSDLGKGISP